MRRFLYFVVCNVSVFIIRKIDILYLYSVYIGEVIKDCVKILVYEWMFDVEDLEIMSNL